MSVESSAKYSVKEIKSSSEDAFAEAIAIYAMHTPPALRTDTREIGHWLDFYNKTFEDRFHILTFYVNRNLAGFCQLVYLKSSNIVAIDYITIDEKYRGGFNVFFEFAEHVKSFVRRNYPNYSYISAEIAPLEGSPSSDDEDSRYGMSLMRLLKMLRFGVVNAPYIQPQLGCDNPGTELRGALMLYPKPINGSLPKESYMKMVKSIYYDHYVRWYGVHGEKYQSEYKSGIDKLYRKMESDVKKDKIIVNGLKHSSDGSPTVEVKHKKTSVGDFLLPMAVMLLLLAATLAIGKLFSVNQVFLFVALLVVATLSFAFSAPQNAKSMTVFKELSKSLRAVFGKVK